MWLSWKITARFSLSVQGFANSSDSVEGANDNLSFLPKRPTFAEGAKVWKGTIGLWDSRTMDEK
jgi:hypothetical protein